MISPIVPRLTYTITQVRYSKWNLIVEVFILLSEVLVILSDRREVFLLVAHQIKHTDTTNIKTDARSSSTNSKLNINNRAISDKPLIPGAIHDIHDLNREIIPDFSGGLVKTLLLVPERDVRSSFEVRVLTLNLVTEAGLLELRLSRLVDLNVNRPLTFIRELIHDRIADNLSERSLATDFHFIITCHFLLLKPQ